MSAKELSRFEFYSIVFMRAIDVLSRAVLCVCRGGVRHNRRNFRVCIDFRSARKAQRQARKNYAHARRLFAARRKAHIYRQNLSATPDPRANCVLGRARVYQGKTVEPQHRAHNQTQRHAQTRQRRRAVFRPRNLRARKRPVSTFNKTHAQRQTRFVYHLEKPYYISSHPNKATELLSLTDIATDLY